MGSQQGAQSAKCADVRADAAAWAETIHETIATAVWHELTHEECEARYEAAASALDALVASLTRAEQREQKLIEALDVALPLLEDGRLHPESWDGGFDMPGCAVCDAVAVARAALGSPDTPGPAAATEAPETAPGAPDGEASA